MNQFQVFISPEELPTLRAENPVPCKFISEQNHRLPLMIDLNHGSVFYDKGCYWIKIYDTNIQLSDL